MTNNIINMPSNQFKLGDGFRACVNGKLYAGKPNTDATVAANQITLTGRKVDGSIVTLTQPVALNKVGQPVDANNNPVEILTEDHYSLIIQDAYNKTQLSFPTLVVLEVGSFVKLRTLPVLFEGQRVRLQGYYADSPSGGGEFIGHLGTKTDDGGIVASGNGFYWERIIYENVQPDFFGAKGNGADDASALKKALAFVKGKRLTLSLTKVYSTSESLDVVLAGAYEDYSTKIIGCGRGSSGITLLPGSTATQVINILSSGARAGYNLFMRDFTICGNQTAYDAGSNQAAIRAAVAISGVEQHAVDCRFVQIGFHIPNNAWINRFVMNMYAAFQHGIKMEYSGTTNYFDNLFVYGTTVTAYSLRGTYSHIGALAADNCLGTIYDLSYFSGRAGSLGSEQPVAGRTPTRFLNIDHGTLDVGFLLAYKSAPTDGTAWTGIYVGTGNITVGHFSISANGSDAAAVNVAGKVFEGYRGNVSIKKITAVVDSNVENSAKLNFTAPVASNSTWSLTSEWGTDVKARVNGKPYMGIVLGDAALNGDGIVALRKLQAIYMDASGTPSGSGLADNKNATRDAYNATPGQGSWFMEVDPLVTGRAGYAITSEGTRLGTSGYAGIPVISTTKPTTDRLLAGQSFFSATLNKPVWWNGTVWVDATGATVTP